MGLFTADRRRRPGGDPWLPHKMALLAGGGIAAALGIALHREALINLAIALLALGILLRFVRRRGEEPPPEQ